MANNSSFVSLSDFVPKLVSVFKAGYSRSMLAKDVFSGLTVGVVALPLAIAFAIGAGAAPAQGLWTAIIAGFAIAALGGSRYQVSGPTGAFVVIIAGVIATHGMSGLILATMMAGVILVVMGVSGLGKLIKFIPYPVTTGFTTGIGVIIAGGQLKDFFGLSIENYSAEFFERMGQVFAGFGTLRPAALAIGAGTVACILLVRRLAPRIPAAVVAVVLSTLAAFLLKLPVETIGSRYGAIPRGLPSLAFPTFDWATLRAVFPAAFTIALLGSIESLLSAVVADGMTGDRHNANMELVAQGAGNILSSLFGGIPATGAIARTAANIKNGAASPVSGMIHAAVLFVFTMFLSGLASAIPLATLSAVLLVVAWDMSELKRFVLMRFAPKSDVIVMLTTFALTVAVDLTVAVEVGVVLAVFLFLKRITETSSVAAVFDIAEDDPKSAGMPLLVPKGIEVYEINGPFFFGTADFLQDVLDQLERPPEAFILRMGRVPAVDATGLNALESFRRHCVKHNTELILCGLREQPRKAMEAMGMIQKMDPENFLGDIDLAIARAIELVDARGKARHRHDSLPGS